MSDPNRLEYSIVATDLSDPGVEKAKRSYRSLTDDIARSAQGISNSFDRTGLEMTRSFDKATAGISRSLQALEQRAALASKTGADAAIAKIRAQQDVLIGKAAGDEAVIRRITSATDRLIQAQLRLNAARAVKTEGTLAGQAILPGQAEFEAALKRAQQNDAAIAQLQRSRVLATESAPQRLAREEAEFLSAHGATPGQRTVISSQFAAQAEDAAEASKNAREFRKVWEEARVAAFASLKVEEGAVEHAAEKNIGAFGRIKVAFREMVDYIKEKGGEMGARLAESIEAAKLGETGIASPFGGFSKLFGTGIAIGIGAHYVDELVKTNIELDHMQAKTGIAAQSLAGLQQIVREQGGDWERFSLGLVRFYNTLEKAREGSKVQANAFQHLGISPTDLKLPPEELFYKVAAGLESVKDHALAVNSAIAIFGKGGQDMIPILKENGAALQEMAKRAGELSGVTPQAIEASKKWSEETAKLGQVMRLVGNLALTFLTPAIQGIVLAVDVLGAAVVTVFEGIAAGVVSLIGGIKDVGLVLNDLRTGNLGALSGHTAAIKNDFVNTWSAGIKDIQGQWTGVGKDKNALFARPRRGEQAGDETADVGGIDKSAIEAAARASRDLSAAGQERLQLEAEQAQIREAARAKEIAALEGNGLRTPDDVVQLKDLAKQRAIAEENRLINEHRYQIDDKTGQRLDRSNTADFQRYLDAANANLPQRIENEQDKIQAEVDQHNAAFFRNQRNAIFSPDNEAQKQQREAARTFNETVQREQKQAAEQYYRDQETGLEREKALALQNLDYIDARTLQEKRAVEDQKLAIEESYAQRSLALQLQHIQTEQTYEEGKLQQDAHGNLTDPNYIAAKRLVDARYNSQRDAATQAAYSHELTLAQQTANAKAKMEIEANQRVFDEMKRESDGFVDAIFSKDPGASLKKWITNLGEGLVKQIISAQLAAATTEIITGNKVTFDPLNSGGRAGDLLGRLGLGRPRFGEQHVDKLQLPNHLGDVQLVSSTDGSTASNSVPVVITNYAQIAQSHAETAKAAQAQQAAKSVTPRDLQTVVSSTISYATGKAGGASLPAVISGLGTLAAAHKDAASTVSSAASAVRTAVTSKISYGGVGFGSVPGGFGGQATQSVVSDGLGGLLPGAPAYVGDTGGQFPQSLQSSGYAGVLPTYVGQTLPGTLSNAGYSLTRLDSGLVLRSPGLIPSVTSSISYGNAYSDAGGFLGSSSPMTDAFNSIDFGGFGGFGGAGGTTDGLMSSLGSPMTDAFDSMDFGGGGAGGPGGVAGGLGGFGGGGGGGALDGLMTAGGTALLANGWQRGGYTGMMEDAAGGALIGYQEAGPIGAAVGAIAGGIAGTVHWIIGTDADHAKKLVKQVYGMDINNATADQIVQIAKQSYGGQIDVAVRSQQVRDLIKLYAEATGSKGQAQFVADTPHAASLVEANGKLLQNAVYDNGNAYSYSSSLGTYGGIQTTPLPTYAPNTGGGNIGSLQLVVNGQSASDLLAGQVANVATPGFIQSQSIAGSSASIGRMQQTALTLAPSAITR